MRGSDKDAAGVAHLLHILPGVGDIQAEVLRRIGVRQLDGLLDALHQHDAAVVGERDLP